MWKAYQSGSREELVIKLMRNTAAELRNLKELSKRPELFVVSIEDEVKDAVPGWTAVAMPRLTTLDKICDMTPLRFDNIAQQLMKVRWPLLYTITMCTAA